MATEKKGRATPRKSVRSVDFVKAWAMNPSIASIAEALDLSESGVKSRAKLYRKKGVKLPEREGEGGGRFDVASLNAMLES